MNGTSASQGWVLVIATGLAGCTGAGALDGSGDAGLSGGAASADDGATSTAGTTGDTDDGSGSLPPPNETDDTTGAPPPETGSSTETGEPLPEPECNFEARTVYPAASGDLVESIIAYGRRYEFVGPGSAPAPQNGEPLDAWPHYAAGPCADQPAGDCHFDTRLVRQVGTDWVESITANGRYWNYTLDLTTDTATPWMGNGASLDDVPRYAAGPCASMPAGQCRLGSREFIDTTGPRVESITADGRYWNFDIDADTGTATAWPSNGETLGSVGRYAAGPCLDQAACAFDSRTVVTIDGSMVESIVAHGAFYNWDVADGSAWPSNGASLHSVVRYATGPCDAAPP